MLERLAAELTAAGFGFDNSASQTVSGFFPGPFSRMTAALRCAGAARAPSRSGPLPSDQYSAVQLTARATARVAAHLAAHGGRP